MKVKSVQSNKQETQLSKKMKQKGKAKGMIEQIIRDRYLYLLLIPFIVWYLVFQYKPMYGLQIAFKDFSVWKGISASPWNGFENFTTFFNSEYFLRNLKNTVVISLYSLIFAFPAPIILALLLNEVRNKYFRQSIQTITYLPYFISIVVVAGIVTNFLAPSGLVNIILGKLGFKEIYFLTIPDYFRGIYIFSMEIWKDVGFNAIIYIAAIAGINPQLYEAATIDGASRFQQVFNVTLPAILPTIVIMLIIKIGNLMEVGYEAIILLYQPATYETADIINTYVYRAGLQGGNYEVAAAAGLFNAVVSLVLVITANKISKKLTDNGLW